MNKAQIQAVIDKVKKFTKDLEKVEKLEESISNKIDKTASDNYYSEDLQNMYERLTTLREAMEDIDNIIGDIEHNMEEDND